jgi:hypothetical protein
MSQHTPESVLENLLSTLDSLKDANPMMAENMLGKMVNDAQVLDAGSMLQVTTAMRVIRMKEQFIRDWQRAVNEKRRDLQAQASKSCAPLQIPQYFERDGAMYLSAFGNNGQVQEQAIATFSARITAEITDDAGNRWFEIQGQTASGQQFHTTLPTTSFCDESSLNAAIVQAAGASAIITAGKSRHVGPAIQSLTKNLPSQVRHFAHTGWSSHEVFLINGMIDETSVLALPDKLPYRVDARADLSQALAGLEALVHAQTPERVLVALTLAFQAPLAKLMGWRSERYGIFLTGPSGSFKTSLATLFAAIYGSDFLNEANLIRLGPGSTVNAIITYATYAHDLPIVIDNFKPNTGLGQRGLTSIIHAIMEGGEKDRLTRTYDLSAARPIHTWPYFTGEDILTHDPASLARTLIVHLDAQCTEDTSALTQAQHLAMHFPAIGWSWLNWLASADAREIASQIQPRFTDLRRAWLDHLKSAPQQSVNAARIATNLATNQMTWMVLEHHPTLGDFARRYRELHDSGLKRIADLMSSLTAQALEATTFLETIQELLTSGRCWMLPAFAVPNEGRDGFIGWRGADGSSYLLPQLARQVVEDVLRSEGGLNQISNHALYTQIDRLGLIQSRDRDGSRHCKTIRNGQYKPQKVLHLAANAFGDAI